MYNRWQYGGLQQRPVIELNDDKGVKVTQERRGSYYFYFSGQDDLFFTENETNWQKLFGKENDYPLVKDAFHEAIMRNTNVEAVRNSKKGTKCSPVYRFNIPGGSTQKIFLRLTNQP